MVAVAASLAFGATAAGQARRLETYERVMQVERNSERLTVSFLCPEIFSDWFKQRLSSGFTSRVVINLQLTDQRGKTLVAQGTNQYTIRYDIWEERYAVRVEGLGVRQDLILRSMDDLVERLGAIRDLPLISLLDVSPDSRYRIQARIVINPTSPEMRRQVREYVAHPDGRSSIGVQPSFFGRFSGFFVDEKKIQADAVLTYRSGLLTIPAPKADGS